MNIDFEAGGSSTDAYWKQLGSIWEEKFTQIGRIRYTEKQVLSYVLVDTKWEDQHWALGTETK